MNEECILEGWSRKDKKRIDLYKYPCCGRLTERISYGSDKLVELYNITDNNIEIWVLIAAYPSEVSNKIIDKWIMDHIREEGLKVESFEFKKLIDITEEEWKRKPFIQIPTRYKGHKMKKVMGKLRNGNISH